MASECIAVPNGNASGKFNLTNDSVLFSVCLISRVKGDDIIKFVTWVNCYYLCSYRTLQFTYYRSLNYIFGVGHKVMEFCDSYAFCYCKRRFVCNGHHVIRVFLLIEALDL